MGGKVEDQYGKFLQISKKKIDAMKREKLNVDILQKRNKRR